MEKEQVKETINLPEGTKELSIAHYYPEEQKHQKGYSIEGTIGAVVAFLEKRTGNKLDGCDIKKEDYLVDQTDTHLEVDREGLYMLLIVENSNPNTNRSVKAILSITKDFKAWQINTGYQWNHKDLAEFIKMNRSCFGSIEEAMKLYMRLRDLKIKVDNEIDRLNDNSGNVRTIAVQNVVESVIG